MVLGALLTVGAIMLTYLEQFYTFADGKALQDHEGTAFMIMAASVFIINTGLAIDAYQEANAINSKQSP